MKAALKTAEGTFVVTEVERPILPASDFVLARVRVAGICGTDLRHWKKHEPELECHIMGHELAGEVVEVGEGVTNVKPGDRVVIETVMGDGVCDYCRIQRYNICEHLYDVRTQYVSRAYGEYVAGPAEKFYKLPDHVSFEEASLIDTFSVCLHAQHLSGLGINDTVAVIGAGPIGLGQMMLAKASGADVIICDVVESALELARELGADAVVNSATEDAVERVKAFTGGRGADIVFECAGGESMPQTLPQATRMVRRAGKVVIVGGFDAGETAIPLEWQRIQMSEIQLIPSASFAMHQIYREQGMVLDLIAKGRIDVKKLITHRFPLDRINEAFDTADRKQETGAVFVAITL
ncbi:zinc-dependent alcohol dehydrogenase [Sphingomonas desiccabilis]|uniref:Alcohol dehydrogenase n=1 Tax=Sphingomonas desiccabilis TaxID=429134 RepID=A0A4Q2IUJ2_9SPHN|nr:zinc-binding dehydrogenase [Sphingomonas desiccabilis]MBB3911136.1 L-iditol 2-dehydrogenase [Sphingomonas desiccabilis]RXZ32058.1 alcohol dehydrogenase [Sphingomonas desiccabilis]